MGRGWLLKWNGPRYLCQVIEIKLFQGIPSFNGISDDNRYLVEEKAFRYFTLTSVSNSLYSFKVLTSTAIFFSQSILNLVGIVNETFLVINTSPIPIGKSLKIKDKKKTRILSTLSESRVTPGGGTPLQEPNGDVPLDGVAFSRLEWL